MTTNPLLLFPTRPRKWVPSCVVGLLCILGVTTLWVMMFGHVTGTELATDTFQLRQFYYMQIPVIEKQILPAKLQPIQNQLVTFIRSQLLLGKGPRRWDVVDATTGGRWHAGKASILNCYLQMTDAHGKLVWLNWSKKNPERAKQLWPAIRETANLQAYEVLPKIFELTDKVHEQVNEDEFARKLHCLLAHQYENLATDLTRSTQTYLADALYAASLRHDAQSLTTRASL